MIDNLMGNGGKSHKAGRTLQVAIPSFDSVNKEQIRHWNSFL